MWNPLIPLQTYSSGFSTYSTSESKGKYHFYFSHSSVVVLQVSTFMNACIQSNIVKCFLNVTAHFLWLGLQNKDVAVGAGSRSMLSWVDCSLCFAVLYKWDLWLWMELSASYTIPWHPCSLYNCLPWIHRWTVAFHQPRQDVPNVNKWVCDCLMQLRGGINAFMLQLQLHK